MQAQLKECSAAIDRQVKAVEEGEREEKRRALEMIYHDAAGEDLELLIPFDRVLEKRWLNKTVSLSAAGRELRKALETHREALRIIRTTCGEDAEACTTEYLRDLSLNTAMTDASAGRTPAPRKLRPRQPAKPPNRPGGPRRSSSRPPRRNGPSGPRRPRPPRPAPS